MKKARRKELGEALQKLIKGDRLTFAVTKQTGQEEGTNDEGGFLVQNNLIAEILAPNFMTGTLYERCNIFNLGDNNNSGARIPIANEPTRNTSGIRGGALAYWVEEGIAKTPSIAEFSIIDLDLNKAAVVIWLTDEIKQDSEMLVQYVQKTAQEAIQWLVDRAILYGNGAQLNGVATHAATGFSAIAGAITAANLKDIFDLYYGGDQGVWVLGQDLWIEITNLWDTATQTPAIPLTWDADGTARLWGYPVVVTDVMSDRSICLGDFSQYVIIQKEVNAAVSESLKFLEDESCFRFVLRINGSPMWVSPLTVNDGSIVHPFVMSAGDEQSSSSSQSSASSSSHSSSSSSSSVDSSSSSSSSSSSENYSQSSGSTSSSSSEEYSGSSSSSSTGGISESSASTPSSSSSSQDSSSSTSQSSESSSSSVDSSSSSSSSSVDSSSTSSLGLCEDEYCGQQFTNTDLNVTWYLEGYNGHYYYTNGGQPFPYYLFWDATYSRYVISKDLGDPPDQWLTAQDLAADCPDGDYEGDDSGFLTAGPCS